MFGLWSAPCGHRVPCGLGQLCHGTHPTAPLRSAAPSTGFGRRTVSVGSTAALLVNSEYQRAQCFVSAQRYPTCPACCGHLAAAPRGVGGTVLQAEEGKQECRRMLFSPKLDLELAVRISFGNVGTRRRGNHSQRKGWLTLRILLGLGSSGGCVCISCTQ